MSKPRSSSCAASKPNASVQKLVLVHDRLLSGVSSYVKQHGHPLRSVAPRCCTTAAVVIADSVPTPVSAVEKTIWKSATSLSSSAQDSRSEEHTSELQSLMRNSYAVFCLKKKRQIDKH